MNQAAQQTSNPATPVRGWLTTFFIPYKGKMLGPYYARSWKVNGKLKREYIKAADAERVRKACEEHRAFRKRGVQIARDFNNTTGNINWLQRMAKRRDKGQLRPEDYDHVEQIQKEGIAIPGRTKLRTFIRPQYLRPDTQNQKGVFMYPSSTKFTNSFKNRLKKEIIRMFDTRFDSETREERHERWRQELSQRPEPRPFPKPRVPSTHSEQDLDALAEKLIVKMDEAVAAKRSPNYRRHDK